MNKEDKKILHETIDDILRTYSDGSGTIECLQDDIYTIKRTIEGLLICLAEKGIVSKNDIGNMC